MKRIVLMMVLFLSVTTSVLIAQKQIYIPRAWARGDIWYSMDHSAQSENFVVFWGDAVGPNPTTFNTTNILNTLEHAYDFFVNEVGFIEPDAHRATKYKIMVIINETWTANVYTGFAFGGGFDGEVGAIFVNARASASTHVLVHELAHALQMYCHFQHANGHSRGSFINYVWVGFFWETHADFMAYLLHPPRGAPGLAAFLNRSHFFWGSTKGMLQYHNRQFLYYITVTDGIEMINRMWREANLREHPVQAYARLKGINQSQLNDHFGNYAMRNVKWDYTDTRWAYFGNLKTRLLTEQNRLLRDNETGGNLSKIHIIPDAINAATGDFKVPLNLAPQQYGYNIIRLHPETHYDSDRRFVWLNFRGQTGTINIADWRFGLVASDAQGNTRFSPLHRGSSGEVLFEMQPNETELHLVVLGAPTQHQNYDHWDPGFARIHRFPYQFRLVGAVPHGFQAGFRAPPTTGGRRHANGGGFVANTATVAASAFVGPNAQVLNSARVEGNARVEGHAIVRDNARVYDNAIVRDFAIVGGDAQVYGNAMVERQARAFGGARIFGSALATDNAVLHSIEVSGQGVVRENADIRGTVTGTAVVGGCAMGAFNVSAGVYLQNMDDRRQVGGSPDGLVNHPLNVYVNAPFTDFTPRQMRHSRSLAYNLVPFSTGENIDAVKYDFGGDSVGHFAVNTQGRSAPAIRDFPGITAHATGGGYYISGLRAGDWLNYTVSASNAGSHSIVLRINSATDRGNVVVTTPQGEFRRSLKNTLGSWDTLLVVAGLATGENVLRIGFESTTQEPLLSFDFFSISELVTSVAEFEPFISAGYMLAVAPTPSIRVDATNIVYATMALNTEIVIYSSSQDVIGSLQVSGQRGTVPLSDVVKTDRLRSGVYFVVLKGDGEIKGVERMIFIR